MTAKRVDSNQREIVQALREIPGVTVTCTHEVGKGFPDIVVGYRGVNYLVEVKTQKGKLIPSEAAWHARWRGQVAVVRTVEEAYRLIGVIE